MITLGSVHAILKRYENQNASNVFVHTSYRLLLDLCLRKARTGKSHNDRDAIVYVDTCFQNCFLYTLKRKAAVFMFLRFEERFRIAPFSCMWRISADGRPNRKMNWSCVFAVVWPWSRPYPNACVFRQDFYPQCQGKVSSALKWRLTWCLIGGRGFFMLLFY